MDSATRPCSVDGDSENFPFRHCYDEEAHYDYNDDGNYGDDYDGHGWYGDVNDHDDDDGNYGDDYDGHGWYGDVNDHNDEVDGGEPDVNVNDHDDDGNYGDDYDGHGWYCHNDDVDGGEPDANVNDGVDDDSDDEDDGRWSMSFKRTYVVHPLSYLDKTHLEAGNKIILPLSALEELMDREVAFPMLFKVKNPTNGKISHCGVLEFSDELEGVAIMPEWMFENMSLEDGGLIRVENVTLYSATYVKLQPHSVKFLEILSPKEFLEGAFGLGYSCLTVGDTIVIMHEGEKLYIDIVDVKPSNAVNMIDTDVEVDFAAPLDYKEPEKEPVSKEQQPVTKEEVTPKFVPFTGRVRRLNETEGNSEESISVVNDVHSNNNVISSNYETRIVDNRDVIPNMEQQTFKPFTGMKYSLMDS